MLKIFFIILSLFYKLPYTSKAYRFYDVLISPIYEITTISFSYLAEQKTDVNFLIYLENPGTLNRHLYKNSLLINYSFSDSFTLFPEYVNDETSLIFTANGYGFSSFVRFDLFKRDTNYDLLEQRDFVFEEAIQYLDDRETVHYGNETISFDRVDSEINILKPYLLFDFIRFKQSSYYYQEMLNYEEIVLEISDEQNIFPLLKHVDKRIKLKLGIAKDKDDYYFELLDKLYVYQDTLLLSDSAKEGFSRTNFIYIPKNYRQTEFDINLSIKGLGLQKLNCYYHYRINVLKKYIGSCSSACNCVTLNDTDIYLDENQEEIFL